MFEIFTRLSRTRQVGFSACPIRIDDIVAMLDFYEIDDVETRREYMDALLELDAVWLEWASKREPRDAKARDHS